MNRSREIIEIIQDVVKSTATGCEIVVTDYLTGFSETTSCPAITYTFGSSRYVKEKLDELGKIGENKFPLIALFCPFNEERNSSDYFSKATVNVLIACSTSKDWSNEERLEYSFRNILRPIYSRFIEALKADGRLDFGYKGIVKHNYSENYSYGRYGARDSTGDAVSEPIDAIDISKLELTVLKPSCR